MRHCRPVTKEAPLRARVQQTLLLSILEFGLRYLTTKVLPQKKEDSEKDLGAT